MLDANVTAVNHGRFRTRRGCSGCVIGLHPKFKIVEISVSLCWDLLKQTLNPEPAT
jgi:hypothetical protein